MIKGENMDYYLLQATTSGLRNIEKPVTIDFYPLSTLSKKLEPKGNNVRGIYGSNGTGKSALILSFLLAQNLMQQPFYLQSKDISYFDNLINKKTQTFSFACDYARYERENGTILGLYAYRIKVEKIEGHYQITEEELRKYKTHSINGKSKPIVSLEKGELVFFLKKPDPLADLFHAKTINLLGTSSFASRYPETEKAYWDQHQAPIESELGEDLSGLDQFPFFLEILVQGEDLHQNDYPSKALLNNVNSLSPKQAKTLLLTRYLSAPRTAINVQKEAFPIYRKYIDHLTLFLQIFKPTLKRIDIEKKEDHDLYHCSLDLVYPDATINQDYESSGIKKLITLFPYLDAADKGFIVFIDEIDANLSGVYLEKLIEFISQYGQGQLIFTAHNLEPMRYLYKFSKSLYFLGENNVMVPWIKNANYRPYLLYPEGMIEGSSFNVEAFDFLSAFGDNK
jgi:AAA15 family ATPase/GTPase